VTISNANDILTAVGAACIALLAIGGVVRWAVVRPLKNFIDREVKGPLSIVRNEVTENQGLSMKDAIGRVENRVSTLDKRFADHLTLHGQVLKTED
jgi:hypothetical protein